MNEQDEKLVRQSKWSGRRVVVLYWFAMVFVGTSAGLGLATTTFNPSFSIAATGPDHSTLGIPAIWHPEDCVSCHADKVDAWNETFHSTLWGDKLSDNGTHILRYMGRGPMVTASGKFNYTEFNLSSGCCMVTRWNNITENPGLPAFWDYGVTCAACHDEPGSVNHTSEMCGDCHGGASGIFDKMNVSDNKHISSLTDLLASGNEETSCLHCMSGQGTYWDMTGVDPTNSTLTPISCATCHDPHSDDATLSPREKDTNFLRGADANELCGKCHLTANVTDSHGGTFWRASLEMEAAFENLTNGFDCTDCHGYNSKAYSWAVPDTELNHSMGFVFSEACTQCHDVPAVPVIPDCPDPDPCPETTECPTCPTTTPSTTNGGTNAIGLVAVLGILGAIVLFRKKRR